MKRIIVVALAVLGVCMTATVSASAHDFTASKLGTLLGKQTGNQVFTTTSGGSAVTCTTAATTGSITALLGLHQLVSVFYSGCTVPLANKVDISTAKYLLSADGLAAIESAITIKVETILGNCTITVDPQDLGTVKYDTDPSNSSALLELSAVTGIVSLSSGEPCGPKGTLTGGTYTGNNLIIEDGGSLSWS